jgi:hypothetical protein
MLKIIKHSQLDVRKRLNLPYENAKKKKVNSLSHKNWQVTAACMLNTDCNSKGLA